MRCPRFGVKCCAAVVTACVAVQSAWAAPLRIMPLGDSITRGPATSSDWDGRSSGGYRRLLAQLLAGAGQEIDLVGSQTHGRFGDAEHEGHGGFRIDQLASGVDGWLTDSAPDVVLLLAGTNGVRWKHDDPADYAAELDELIGRIFRRMRGEVHVSLASIPPILASDQHFLNNWKVEIFNAYLPDIVQKHRAAGRRISFVDVHRVLDPATDMWSDGIHPTRSGFEKIAHAFAADVLLAIPEPSALALTLLGLWAANRRRRTPDGVERVGPTAVSSPAPRGRRSGVLWRHALCVALTLKGGAAAAQGLPHLRVSADQRRLETAGGKPFFWLADTAWELFHRLTREEVEQYLAVRQQQGFNVVQAVAIAELSGDRVPNAYGHLPLIDADPSRPEVVEGVQNDYWDHVDFVVEAANRRGIYIGLLPTWGNYWDDSESAPILFDRLNAESFGRFLGQRYKDRGVVWILGGDRHVVNDGQREILRAMARGLRSGDGGAHLITFHPRGGHGSSEYFHAEPWLDFHMRQNGHSSFYEAFALTRQDFELSPPKPVIDGEPLYEGHPVYRPDGSGLAAALDVRRALYWDLFAGACGHTYGHSAVWQMWSEKHEPINNPEMVWSQAIRQPGAEQMQWGRRLIESRPLAGRIPANDLIVSADVDQDEPAFGRFQFVGTRAADGSFAMIYAPVGRKFRVRLDLVRGTEIKAWWYDPRHGQAHSIDPFEKSPERDFMSPNPGEEVDWVLVLDDAACGFPPPGSVPP